MRACAHVCVCVVCMYALRIVSTDKILPFINTLIVMMCVLRAYVVCMCCVHVCNVSMCVCECVDTPVLLVQVLCPSCLGSLCCYCVRPPEGKLEVSDVALLPGISGLSFDSPFLSPLLVCCLYLVMTFIIVIILLMLQSPVFPPENSPIFFSEIGFLCIACVEFLDALMVGRQCVKLLYGTDGCSYYAFILVIYVFVHSFFLFFLYIFFNVIIYVKVLKCL